MSFDWDDANILHVARHDITPDEAEQVFRNDPQDMDRDDDHGEERFNVIGETNARRILVRASTIRERKIRVITGFVASRAVKASYLEWRRSTHG